MLKTVKDKVFSFDMEWVPDSKTGELLYGDGSFETIWKNNGATEENPSPYLKPLFCKIVSCSGILREKDVDGDVSLSLITLDGTKDNSEKKLIKRLLKAIGGSKPQIVGFNSRASDWSILVQRSLVHGLQSYGVADRPDKPWEGVDYYRNDDYNVDLVDCFVPRYGTTPKLEEAATLCGIPGKIVFEGTKFEGKNVASMYQEGMLEEILKYNEFDAFTTHLLWARCAKFSELLTEEEYTKEVELVEELLQREISDGKDHLELFVAEWERIKGIINS